MVYLNNNPKTKQAIPYLLDVQSDVLSNLETRVVVPLYLQERRHKVMSVLTPTLEIKGQRYTMMTPQLAGMPRSMLKKSVASLAERRGDVVAALDLLFTGF